MQEYVATFFTHYDAIIFRQQASSLGCAVKLCPVPRTLSSSCGTCARWAADALPEQLANADYERLLVEDGSAWREISDKR